MPSIVGVAGFFLVLTGVWLFPSVLAGRLASKRGGNGRLWSIIALACVPFSWLVVALAVAMNRAAVAEAQR